MKLFPIIRISAAETGRQNTIERGDQNMAKYKINHSCGHTSTAQLYGNKRDRQWRIEKMESEICTDCYKEKQIEADKKSAEENAAAGLPALTGSEKQILWAEKIRAEKLALIDQLADMPTIELPYHWEWRHLAEWVMDDLKHIPATDKQAAWQNAWQLPIMVKAVSALKAQTKASWWIDNRDIKLSALFAALIKTLPREVSPEEKALEIDAAVEATVRLRPEHPHTETVAEIQLHDNSISVHFPEKLEAFRLLMRANDYTWSGSAWTRAINRFTGAAQDRAAEIGHKLLGSGFIIRIYNEDARAKAITGDFEPEQTRWVKVRVGGEYKDWFAIEWSRDEDFYRQAKRLHRAQYSKPHVVVPAENFEEVQDFAKAHDFRLSPGAQQLIDKTLAEREAALVVHVDPPEPVRNKRLSEKPAKLDVPDVVDVDESLIDD
jgi:hypothetical protein